MTRASLDHLSFDIATLAAGYASGAFTPVEVVAEALRRIEASRDNPIWISVRAREQLIDRARSLGSDPAAQNAMPLYGIPFAVKDNIDAAGIPTTAACPAFARTPPASAPAVVRLEAAGAILIGKTNLDQFATGLVGARSPYGPVRNAFHRAYVSGGSSSGSAVAVATGMVAFSLGTDTAGSGRVPAGFNDIVGMKPTRGLISTCGVLPACRTLDCVSVFATCVADATRAFEVLNAFDPDDAYARAARALAVPLPARFRFGLPDAAHLDFSGDRGYAKLFEAAIARLQRLGGTPVEIDFAPFAETARLLYEGPWVAERYAAIREMIEQRPDALLPVIRTIIEGARKYSAADAFDAEYRLAELRRRAEPVWSGIDVMVVPTAPTIYTVNAVNDDPVGLNADLGRFTNFVNLLDLAALAIPAGFRDDGLPFGVTLIAPALTDLRLAALGARIEASTRGDVATPLVTAPAPTWTEPQQHVRVAVVGAHLTGQPLNGQLLERNARLVARCRTAATYRLYALPNTHPPKPGLAQASAGASIEVEVWEMPMEHFGSFVALIPGPLGIGTLTLEDGSEVKGFICEPHALERATDITQYGGWRAYLASRAVAA